MLPTNLLKEFLVSEGFSGELNEALYDYLKNLGYSGQLNDMLYRYLLVTYNTDNITEGLTAWEEDLLGGSSFSPSSLNPYFWIDASNTSSIVEVGGSVSQIDDLSGNNYHAVQGTASKQPLTGSQTINGLNVLAFDSDGLRASVPAGTFPSGFEVTYIWQKTGASIGNETVTNRTVGNAGRPFDRYNNRLVFGSSITSSMTDIRTLTSPTVVSLVVQDITQPEYINGVLTTTGDRTGYSDTGTQILVGIRDDEAVLSRGNIGEIIYTPILTTQQRSDLVNHYISKWGIS